MNIQTKNFIEVSEWDALVEKTYGRTYNLQQQGGCHDRGILTVRVPEDSCDYDRESIPEEVNGNEMGVSFEAWLARDPKQPLVNQKYDFELRLWWERNFYPALEVVANDLYEKGLLPAGEYVINIDW